ncbi:MAG TPA: allantoinase AllB [Candidatus Dormibacteraeota bacterium]|nr:allantoinase AllB [Candidatus Dormibacteraeota bacterium]
MAQFDLIIRDGTVVRDTEEMLDIGIKDGCIAELRAGLDGSATETLNAQGRHIFPGVIDSHVHFNEPGRTEWEGFETGSRAFAAGGGTLFFDMPLNAHPPTLDGASFDLKLGAAQKSSLVDFGLWGGLVPGNLGSMQELAERGVVGFKAFMSNSGIEDFPRADDRTLRRGMEKAAALNKLVAVHAESEETTSKLAQEAVAAGRTTVRDYLNSRPLEAELVAIQKALSMAGETKCRLHIVHVSCGEGIALIASAQKLGVDVSCETCPHYLLLTEDDMEKIGALAKCAPPLRPKNAQDSLWECVKAGEIDTLGSDHSPSPPEMKEAVLSSRPNFFKVWGGISGVQHTLPLLTTEAPSRGLELSRVSKLLSTNVAERFRLPRNKGRIEIGAHADFAIVDVKQTFDVRLDHLLYHHKHTPYAGRRLTGKVRQTILRGKSVFKDGRVVSEPRGQLVKPID